MIYTSRQYYSRKQKIREFKNSLKNQIVKLAIFAIICVLVGSLVDKNTAQSTYTIYYAQNKIVNKHLRGVFPPLEGNFYNLYGCWEIAAKIGKQRIDSVNFKNYTLCFQQSGRMMVKKRGPECPNPFSMRIYQWKAFSHNLFISEQKISPVPKANQQKPIQNGSDNIRNSSAASKVEWKEQVKNEAGKLAKPSECFSQNEAILEQIRSFTVWTVRENNIYLISQAITAGKVEVSIIVLNKKY